MLLRLALALAAVLLLPTAPASAGDPIMPLGDVRSGMQCTGYSVVRGTEVAGFDVEVIDVVDDRASGDGPQILVRASGPAVDATGIGPGFSGSPIYCSDAQGTARNIGAISAAIGEYGGKVVLATPIEAILGTPVDPPRGRATRRLPAGARPLTAPLTVSGLHPRLGAALASLAAKRGRMLITPPAGPAGSFPVQTLRPGSALGAGYATGDLAASALGTVAYTDGDRVWGFGHPLEGVGRRSLLLQDGYVFRVINNPVTSGDSLGSYKLAVAGHTLGTLTSDGLSAVAGRIGALPTTIPVRIYATDTDSGAKQAVETDIADEAVVDQPTGGSALSLLAPLAVAQAGGAVLRGSPARLHGRACFAISMQGLRKPVRFCNRYLTDLPDLLGGNSVASAASGDLAQALSLIEGFKARALRVTGVVGTLQIGRGLRQAYLRQVRLPRRARAGARVRATLVLRHVRGRLERRGVRLRLPSDLRPGHRRLSFTGPDVDSGDDFLSALLELLEGEVESEDDGFGPANLRSLVARIDALARYDGVTARAQGGARGPGTRAYRDPGLRISGQAAAAIRIKRR